MIINLLKPNLGEQNCTARNTTNTSPKTNCRLYFRTVSFMVTFNSRVDEFRMQYIWVFLLSTLQSFRLTSSLTVLFKHVKYYRADLKAPYADSSMLDEVHEHRYLIMFLVTFLICRLNVVPPRHPQSHRCGPPAAHWPLTETTGRRKTTDCFLFWDELAL